ARLAHDERIGEHEDDGREREASRPGAARAGDERPGGERRRDPDRHPQQRRREIRCECQRGGHRRFSARYAKDAPGTLGFGRADDPRNDSHRGTEPQRYALTRAMNGAAALVAVRSVGAPTARRTNRPQPLKRWLAFCRLCDSLTLCETFPCVPCASFAYL